MVNITHKHTTLRKAIAHAVLTVSSKQTLDAIVNKQVPKGDVVEFGRAAGLLAIKKTSDVIPDCHPLPVEYASITYAVEELTIRIIVEVHAIYRTGVEVEAMHGAAITALTLYDMLKPLDNGLEISTIRLHHKSGGKQDQVFSHRFDIRCAVVVCSDTVSKGNSEDTAGHAVMEKLASYGVQTEHYSVVPDEQDVIADTARRLTDAGCQLIIFVGGTGVSPRDVTPDALAPLIDRPVPGMAEAARNFGQQRTPYAMLSRGVSGYIGNTLVLTLPGSRQGAVESMDALFPAALHSFAVKQGDERHGRL